MAGLQVKTWLTASGTTAWAYDVANVSWFSDHLYVVSLRATDRAGNTSMPLVYSTTPVAPRLIAPTNNSTSGSRPRFDWAEVPGAEYLLEVDDNSDFSSPIIHWPDYLAASDYVPSIDLPKGTCYWRVLAVSSAGAFSPWSEVWQVTVTGRDLYVSPAVSSVVVSNTVAVELRLPQASRTCTACKLKLSFDPTILEVVDAYDFVPGVQIEEGDFPTPDVVAAQPGGQPQRRHRVCCQLAGEQARRQWRAACWHASSSMRDVPGVSSIRYTEAILSDPQSRPIAVPTPRSGEVPVNTANSGT